MEVVAIAIDIGTSSLKVAVVDIDGEVLFHKRCFFPSPLRLVHLVPIFMNSLDDMIKWAEKERCKVLGLSISGNGPSIVALDRNDRKKDVLFMWNEYIDEGKKNRCKKEICSSSIFLPRFLLFKELYKDIYQSSTSFLPLVEYLIFLLCGTKVAVLSEKRFLPYYWQKEDLEDIGFKASLLPQFVELGERVGYYKNIPIFAGPPDYVAALIGTGTLFEGTACDVAGSSEGINIVIQEKPPSYPSCIRLMPSPIPNLWTLATLFCNNGTRFLSALLEIKKTYHFRSEELEDNFLELMEELSQYYFEQKNVREPFSHAYNLLNDILIELKEAFNLLEKLTGFEGGYALSGGHAKNVSYLKIKSHFTHRSFSLLNHADAELLGDAIIVFYKCGIYSSLQEGAKSILKERERFEPI